MHLHGFNMYILHEGGGPWDGTIINRNNPQRRDVIQVRPNGHVVIQFDAANNPGALLTPDIDSLGFSLANNLASQASGPSTATLLGTSPPAS